MMPLTFIGIGQVSTVIKVKGQEKNKKFLESLGFVEGTSITVVAHNAGNIIVNVKDSRIAISQELANKIMVRGE